MVIRRVFLNGRRPCIPIESSLARELNLAAGDHVVLTLTTRGTMEVQRLDEYYRDNPTVSSRTPRRR